MKNISSNMLISYSFMTSIVLVLLVTNLFSLSIGSNITGSRQPLVTFPASGTDNRMLGFAAFEKGFILANNTTTCTFNDFFPISGTVTLRGGRLHLLQDILFNKSLNITTSGSFFAAGHSIEFGFLTPDLTLSSSLTFDSAILVLNTDTRIHSSLQFRNSCKILGRGHIFQLQGNSSIIVRPGGTLILEDIELQGVSGNNIRCMTDRGAITLQNTIVSLANNYTFSQGTMLFSDDVVFTGSTQFIYTTGLTSTIDTQSLLFFDQGTTFSYASRSAKQNLIFMTDATSKLYLNGCTLYSTRTGLQLSLGSLIIDNKVTMSSQARFDAEALRLRSDLSIIMNSGSELDIFGRVKYG